MKISSTRGSITAHSDCRLTERAGRPPTDGTSIISSSPTIATIAQPCLCLMRSASECGERNP